MAKLKKEDFIFFQTTILNLVNTSFIIGNERKNAGHQPPPEMLAIWNYEHEKMVKEFKEAKFIVEEYNRY